MLEDEPAGVRIARMCWSAPSTAGVRAAASATKKKQQLALNAARPTSAGRPRPYAEISHDGADDTRLHGAVFTSSVRGVVRGVTRQGSRPNGLTKCHDGPALAFVAGLGAANCSQLAALELELASIMKGERS